MVIVTKDKGIIVFNKDDEEIEIYNSVIARDYILRQMYIRTELNRLGIITEENIEKYERERKEKLREQEEIRKQQLEKQEYQQYLKLKEKYEGRVTASE